MQDKQELFNHPLGKALHHASFHKSAAKLEQCPPDQGVEVVFAGRSNAGKSSTINGICSQNGLAKVSKQPGRTQLLNFFDIDETNCLVDLPGYGYAKVAESVKNAWVKSIETYFAKRESLKGVVIVTDIRHAPNTYDKMLIEWCTHFQIPVVLHLNKADKLSQKDAQKVKNKCTKFLKSINENSDQWGLSVGSVHTKKGLWQLLDLIEPWFELSPK
jgi:GTP-binding protein